MREIKNISVTITPLEVDETFETSPADWLAARVQEYDPGYLLAHADDGVIWGRVEGQQLRLASEFFPAVSPPLRAISLQQARLFGPGAELMVWRGAEGWQARLVRDEAGQGRRYYDEAQVLWGNAPQGEPQAGFTLVADGEMGHCHAVPLAVDKQMFKETHRPLRLAARHYLEKDEASGLLRVTLSRLLNLNTEAPA